MITHNIGLGTLALSGKYQKKTLNQVKKELFRISPNYFDYIDWAYVYAENGIDLFEELSVLRDWNKKDIVFKFGRANSHDFDKLIYEAKKILESNWKGKKILMFHNVSEELWKNHSEFIKFAKSLDSCQKIDFGISCHNVKNSRKYLQCEDISFVQMPFNLIDANDLYPMLYESKKYKKNVQVRSIFGAGLFSGKFLINDIGSFKDPIRSKWNFDDKIFSKRYERYILLKNFLKDFNNKFNLNITVLEIMLHFIKKHKNIDSFITGGSNSLQINGTCMLFKKNNQFLEKEFPYEYILKNILKF